MTLSVAPGVSIVSWLDSGKGAPSTVTWKILGGSASIRVIGSPNITTVLFMACWRKDADIAFRTYACPTTSPMIHRACVGWPAGGGGAGGVV